MKLSKKFSYAMRSPDMPAPVGMATSKISRRGIIKVSFVPACAEPISVGRDYRDFVLCQDGTALLVKFLSCAQDTIS